MANNLSLDVTSLLDEERMRLWKRLGELGGDYLMLCSALESNAAQSGRLYAALGAALVKLDDAESALSELGALMSQRLH